jgi:hypothetical protein
MSSKIITIIKEPFTQPKLMKVKVAEKRIRQIVGGNYIRYSFFHLNREISCFLNEIQNSVRVNIFISPSETINGTVIFFRRGDCGSANSMENDISEIMSFLASNSVDENALAKRFIEFTVNQLKSDNL